MTLRVKLVLCLLLLSIVPLLAVTLYSFVTSQRVFRQAVEAKDDATIMALKIRQA